MRMTAFLVRCTGFVAGAALLHGCASNPGASIIDVGPGWAGNSVNAVVFRKNALASDGAHQYIAYYERGPLAMRLSYNYKDRSLHGDNPRNNGDDLIRWRAARGYLDGTISYKLSENLELRLDALNLTDTLNYDYFEDATGQHGSGKHTRMDYAKYDGRTFKIGIRGKL